MLEKLYPSNVFVEAKVSVFELGDRLLLFIMIIRIITMIELHSIYCIMTDINSITMVTPAINPG